MSESLQKFYSKHPQKVERLRQYTFNTRFQKGHSVPEEWKERYRQRRLGHKLSEESKTKITRNLLKFYLEHPEMRERFSRERKGMNHWNWKGGKTAGIELLRHSQAYDQWRKAVYARDNWTCQICGKKEHQIIAHHIQSFNDFPGIRFEVENGITLCRSCHKKHHAEIGLSTQFRPAFTGTWTITIS